MGVSLAKGGNVSLSKEAPGLTAVVVGLRAVPQSPAGARRQLQHLAALSERPHTSSMRTPLRLAMHRI
nr:TerD family protein [Streptomyces sp. NBC_00857]